MATNGKATSNKNYSLTRLKILEPPNSPPEYVPPPPPTVEVDLFSQKLTLRYEFTWKLPKTYDRNGHKIVSEVIKLPPRYFTYIEKDRTILINNLLVLNPDNGEIEENLLTVGKYPVELTLTDSKDGKTTYKLDFDIVAISKFASVIKKQVEVKKVVVEEKPPENNFKAYIYEINNQGVVTVKFTEEVKDLNLIVFDDKTINITLGLNNQGVNTTFNWTFWEFIEDGFKVNLTFGDPLVISSTLKDFISIRFMHPENIFSAKTGLPLNSVVVESDIGK